MSIKSDRRIRRMARERGTREPFEEAQVRQGVVSFGASSHSYDMGVSRDFRIFTNVYFSLPTKIYAEEGIAQVLFFEADDD